MGLELHLNGDDLLFYLDTADLERALAGEACKINNVYDEQEQLLDKEGVLSYREGVPTIITTPFDAIVTGIRNARVITYTFGIEVYDELVRTGQSSTVVDRRVHVYLNDHSIEHIDMVSPLNEVQAPPSGTNCQGGVCYIDVDADPCHPKTC